MYMKGMQDNGVMACAKHFPGHGDTDVDSHTGLPVITGDRQRFNTVELIPFRRLSEEGVGSVMSAHINVPALDATPRLPSTFSRKVITGLLKEEIGYKGLVLTDAMNMAGATLTYPSGIADAEALKAGNDVIEYSTDPLKAIAEIALRVERLEIGVDEIRSRCEKVLAAKLWLSELNRTDQASSGKTLFIPASAHPALIRDLYAGAMTLIENNDNLVPVGRLDKVKCYCGSQRLAMTEFSE
jgi:beta-glucosidase-like glycosyl hydrolase